MAGQIPEHPEVINMSGLPLEEPEPDVVPNYVAQIAEIGDVFQQGVEQPVPDGWHECDGSRLSAYEWPDFTAAMRIDSLTFVLPSPERALPGQRWIIKLGRHREPHEIRTPAQLRPTSYSGPRLRTTSRSE